MSKNEITSFLHPPYGYLNARFENNKIYFKEYDIINILIKAEKSCVAPKIKDNKIILDLDQETEYSKVKQRINKITDKKVKEDLLQWMDSIKKHFKLMNKTKEDVSKEKEFDDKKLYRVTQIGSKFNMSGYKVNMLLQLKNVLKKTKDGYELNSEYKDLGKRVFVKITDEQGRVLKNKNYIVYNNTGKVFIENMIKEYLKK